MHPPLRVSDSPPTMTQWMPDSGKDDNGPNNGSHYKNRTDAGVTTNHRMRSTTAEDSTLVPTRIFGVQAKASAIRAFGQHLIRVPRSLLHYPKHLGNERVGHFGAK